MNCGTRFIKAAPAASPRPLAKPSVARRKRPSGRVISVLVVVVILLLAIVSYSAFLAGPNGGRTTTSAVAAGIFTGALFYNGTNPQPSSVSYPLSNGTLASGIGMPGQVVLLVGAGTAVGPVQSLVSAQGGRLLSQVPLAGMYLVNTTAGNEPSLITHMRSSSLVLQAIPNLVESPGGSVNVQNYGQGWQFGAIQDPDPSAQVILAQVDEFCAPPNCLLGGTSHGSEVGQVLNTVTNNAPLLQVDVGSPVTLFGIQKAILAAVNVAAEHHQKLVLNLSMQCTTSDPDAFVACEKAMIGAVASSDWAKAGNVVVTQSAGNIGFDMNSQTSGRQSVCDAIQNDAQIGDFVKKVWTFHGQLSTSGTLAQYANGGSNHGSCVLYNYSPCNIYGQPFSCSDFQGTSFVAPVEAGDQYNSWSQTPTVGGDKVVNALWGASSANPYGFPIPDPGTLRSILKGAANGTAIPLTFYGGYSGTVTDSGPNCGGSSFAVSGSMVIHIRQAPDGGYVFSGQASVASNLQKLAGAQCGVYSSSTRALAFEGTLKGTSGAPLAFSFDYVVDGAGSGGPLTFTGTLNGRSIGGSWSYQGDYDSGGGQFSLTQQG